MASHAVLFILNSRFLLSCEMVTIPFFFAESTSPAIPLFHFTAWWLVIPFSSEVTSICCGSHTNFFLTLSLHFCRVRDSHFFFFFFLFETYCLVCSMPFFWSYIFKLISWRAAIPFFLLPSGHLVQKWRRMNVDATWWRRIDVDPTSFSYQMPAGLLPV